MLFKNLFMHENLNKKLKCYIFENSSLSVYNQYYFYKELYLINIMLNALLIIFKSFVSLFLKLSLFFLNFTCLTKLNTSFSNSLNSSVNFGINLDLKPYVSLFSTKFVL